MHEWTPYAPSRLRSSHQKDKVELKAAPALCYTVRSPLPLDESPSAFAAVGESCERASYVNPIFPPYGGAFTIYYDHFNRIPLLHVH